MERSYRISVKREGKGGVSDWLHDRLRIGDVIEVLSSARQLQLR